MPRKKVETISESPPTIDADAEVEVGGEAPVESDLDQLLAEKARIDAQVKEARKAKESQRVGKICPLLFMTRDDWDKSLCIEGACGWWVALENNPDGGACTWKLLPVVIGDRE